MISRLRVARHSQEQVGIHQDRWDGDAFPLLPPRTARLPAPVPTPPMRANRPAASPVARRTDLASFMLVQRDLLSKGIPHRHQPHFQVGLRDFPPPLAGELRIP